MRSTFAAALAIGFMTAAIGLSACGDPGRAVQQVAPDRVVQQAGVPDIGNPFSCTDRYARCKRRGGVEARCQAVFVRCTREMARIRNRAPEPSLLERPSNAGRLVPGRARLRPGV